MKEDWKEEFREKWEGANIYPTHKLGLPTRMVDHMVDDIESLLSKKKEEEKIRSGLMVDILTVYLTTEQLQDISERLDEAERKLDL